MSEKQIITAALTGLSNTVALATYGYLNVNELK